MQSLRTVVGFCYVGNVASHNDVCYIVLNYSGSTIAEISEQL